jgi:hypothetical protein
VRVQQLLYPLTDPNPVVFSYPTSIADDAELPGLNAQHAEHEKLAKACGLSFMFYVQATEP